MSTLVVVTGGSRGLGAAVLATAPTGARRIDVSRGGPGRSDVEHLAADLADPASWPTLADRLGSRIRAWEGERVTVVHAAGTLDPIGFAGEVDDDRYTTNVLLNSAAAQVVGHAVLTALRDHGAGRRELVLLSSGAASKAYPGWSAYGAGKAATDHWVRTVGAEQQQRGGVRVLAVAPGVVATDMQATIRATSVEDFPAVERFRDLHAHGELTDPADAARGLWTLLEDPNVVSGSVVDLRQLG